VKHQLLIYADDINFCAKAQVPRRKRTLQVANKDVSLEENKKT
jgi:hypothetical protein